uniref:Uncharacterized protein n=1 Tax=Knipowitschia caucasica TaxID=637954 RepID=A0AAV2K5R3_KNICA
MAVPLSRCSCLLPSPLLSSLLHYPLPPLLTLALPLSSPLASSPPLSRLFFLLSLLLSPSVSPSVSSAGVTLRSPEPRAGTGYGSGDHPTCSGETERLQAWADNANACAVQYAGTGALKTDFTRTGKRTQWGLLMDGWNSMIRYYKNNFSDGFRQDAIDLFLGNFAVDETDGPTPLREQKDWKFLTLPIIMLVAFSMCIVCLLMAGDTWTETLAYVMFWGAASTITAAIILYNGQDFVDSPKLVHKEKLD